MSLIAKSLTSSMKLYPLVMSICGSALLANAQSPLDEAKKQVPTKQVPTNKEAIEDHAEFHSKTKAKDDKTKSNIITERIKLLHERQAQHLKKVASGEIKPNADLVATWDKIQSDVLAIQSDITTLNKLTPDDRNRPSIEAKILGALKSVGQYLLPAGHPKFTPRKFDKKQIAEMARIETAMQNMTFGDRRKAQPVEVVGGSSIFTLIQLPIPLVLKSKPGEKIYLVATTGGTFANGLPLTELETDKNGIARTTWISIGESVGTCYVAMHSQVAIETQQLQIEVVAPSLAILDGLPKPHKALLRAPNIPKKPIPLRK